MRPGQIKGFVLHRTYSDRLFFSQGTVKVVLYDDREGSPTRGMLNELFFGENNRGNLVIPACVWHAVQRRLDRCPVRQLPDEALQPRGSGQVGPAEGQRRDSVSLLRG